MKSKSPLLAAMMMMAMLESPIGNQGRPFDLDSDREPVKKPIPKGAKEWSFYGVTAIAINEKSVRAKAKKKAGIN